MCSSANQASQSTLDIKTCPDEQGTPALRPELALNVDVAWECSFGHSGKGVHWPAPPCSGPARCGRLVWEQSL
jgi:hypothetical protein